MGHDSLFQCIGQIRRILGDDASAPRVVRTVSRRGYQSASPAEKFSAAGESLTLEETTTVQVRVEEEQSESSPGVKRWTRLG